MSDSTDFERWWKHEGFAGFPYDKGYAEFAWTAARAWYDIETAPKDGTLILVGWIGHQGVWRCETVYWDHGDWSASAGWLARPPTHWQPLADQPRNGQLQTDIGARKES